MAEVWIRKYNGTTITMCYKVKVFDSIDWKFASPISPMPLPEESGEENILVKMEGNTHTLNLIWLVKNQDENAGVTNSSYTGTNAGYTENSKTIFQQLKWLSSEDGGFIGRHIEDEFDIVVLDSTTGLSNLCSMANATETGAKDEFQEVVDTSGNVLQMKGYIRNTSLRTSSGEPATFRAQIEFIQGKVIGGYQSQVPSTVRNFKVVAGTDPADEVDITYTAPQRIGSSVIVAYDIAYRKIGTSSENPWIVATPSPANANSVTVSSLDPSSSYSFKVAARNASGRGEWSYAITIVTSS